MTISIRLARTQETAHAFARASMLAPLLCLVACVSAERTLPDGRVERVPRSQLPAYAQEVFKHRNAVSTEYLLRTPELDDDSAAAGLAAAEQAMDRACAPVDALAIAYRDGQDVGLRAKLDLVHALAPCEAATRAAEQALKDANAP